MTEKRVVVSEHLSHAYGAGASKHTVLDDVSCAVEIGQRVALIGESGSGKSTLLHLLVGMEEPQTGSVLWPRSGRDVRVAFVFQEPSLLDPINVVANVAMPLLLAGCDRAKSFERATSALDRLSLGYLRDRLPDQLSGGQAQRVAIARALAMHTELFIADEPTGKLDRETAAGVMTTLFNAADEANFAMIVATHDASVAALFDEQWRVGDSRLEIEGTLR